MRHYVTTTPKPRRSAPATAGLALAAAVLLTWLAPASAAPQGDLVVERFHADITVEPDGSVTVEEQIEVDFGDVDHHGILRAITTRYDVAEDDTQVEIPSGREPADYRRVIDVHSIEVDATAPDQLRTERDGDQLVLRIGDPDVTVTGQHTYRIAYAVDGVLNAFEDRAELYWQVTGFAWEAPIGEATATIHAPGVVDAACYEGPAGTSTPCTQLDVTDDTVQAAAGSLEPGEGLTISVGIPPDAVAVSPPLLEERWRLSRALTGSEATLPLTAATAILGLAAIALTWRRTRAAAGTDQPPPGSRPFRSDPPEGLRPAQVSLLADERLDDAAASATVLDLAARGHLEIEPEIEPEGDGGDERYTIRRTTPRGDGELLDFERPLLDALFADAGSEGTVRSDDLGDEYFHAQARLREDVEREAVAREWFTERPSAVRARRGGAGAGLVLGALTLLGVALALTELALAAVPLVFAAVALAVLVYRQPVATPEGRRLAAEAQGFKDFLRDQATAHPHPGDDPSAVFGRYLPYAVALGVAAEWVARFRDLPAEQWAPSYYVFPVAVLAHDPGRYTASLGGFTGQIGASAAPSSSTSSGGGHVGGGFGGGGGGGW